MQRQKVSVTLEIIDGDRIEPVSSSTKYAFNSAIRASEDLARQYARSRGYMLAGDAPSRTGDVYTRIWRNGDTKLIATVERQQT